MVGFIHFAPILRLIPVLYSKNIFARIAIKSSIINWICWIIYRFTYLFRSIVNLPGNIIIIPTVIILKFEMSYYYVIIFTSRMYVSFNTLSKQLHWPDRLLESKYRVMRMSLLKVQFTFYAFIVCHLCVSVSFHWNKHQSKFGKIGSTWNGLQN